MTRVYGHDRDLILRLLCDVWGQEISWRRGDEGARDGGNLDEASACENGLRVVESASAELRGGLLLVPPCCDPAWHRSGWKPARCRLMKSHLALARPPYPWK